MNILGVSCFYHDSSACIVQDGRIVAAAQEERFSRVKNTSAFPIHSINFCIQQAGITFDDIDAVGYFEKPYLKFARVMIEHLNSYPFSLKSFMRSLPKWLDDRLTLPLLIQSEIGYSKDVTFLKHHLSHAASAFLPSPFEEAAILTADGVGEWSTLTVGTGHGSKIKIEKEIQYPDSLGLLYTAFTVFLGFHSHGGEGKTMGMAGYGEPRFEKQMYELIHVFPDGSFRLNQKYFSYRHGDKMWNKYFEALFGSPRQPGEPVEQRHYDIAASLQKVVEDILIGIARQLQNQTKMKNLCLAGGVTLNCVANAKMLEQTDFQDIFVQPAAGDAGGSVGSALYISHCMHNHPRQSPMHHAFLGPQFSDREVYKAIRASGFENVRKLSEEELLPEVARHIWENKTVGWFSGRMEFGPRALGGRSILANPCNDGIKQIINDKIKKREPFRPFAPLVLEEKANEYFHLSVKSPYMLLAPQVRAEKKSVLPAITHVDGTARVQTVDQDSHPRLRKLIQEFAKLSGVSVLLNTSFNRNGEPVVCLPEHALRCFMESKMDVLVLEDYILVK